jgi:hypothetical protein
MKRREFIYLSSSALVFAPSVQAATGPFERPLRDVPESVIFRNLAIRLVPLSFQRTQSV